MTISTDGIVRGFQAGVSLPAGKNKIGSVEIDDTDMVLFQTIGENIDNIDSNVGAMMINVASNLSNTNKIAEDVAEIVAKLTAPGGAGADTYLYYINGDCYDKTPVYLNQASEVSYTAGGDCSIYFNYLLNDGADVAIKINNSDVLTVYSGEQITDLSFKLKAGDVITVSGEGANIRAKYFVF